MIDVVTIGSADEEILYKQAAAVSDINEKIIRLTDAMIESLSFHKGIGLAGPQVNEQLRLFVTHVQGDVPRVFINPEIIMTSNEMTPYEEGCLSVPGIYADVMRPAQVSIQAWNEKGKPFTLDAEGMLARVIQHEYDHLRGKLFIDRINDKKKERLLKTYNKKIRQ